MITEKIKALLDNLKKSDDHDVVRADYQELLETLYNSRGDYLAYDKKQEISDIFNAARLIYVKKQGPLHLELMPRHNYVNALEEYVSYWDCNVRPSSKIELISYSFLRFFSKVSEEFTKFPPRTVPPYLVLFGIVEVTLNYFSQKNNLLKSPSPSTDINQTIETASESSMAISPKFFLTASLSLLSIAISRGAYFLIQNHKQYLMKLAMKVECQKKNT